MNPSSHSNTSAHQHRPVELPPLVQGLCWTVALLWLATMARTQHGQVVLADWVLLVLPSTVILALLVGGTLLVPARPVLLSVALAIVFACQVVGRADTGLLFFLQAIFAAVWLLVLRAAGYRVVWLGTRQHHAAAARPNQWTLGQLLSLVTTLGLLCGIMRWLVMAGIPASSAGAAAWHALVFATVALFLIRVSLQCQSHARALSLMMLCVLGAFWLDENLLGLQLTGGSLCLGLARFAGCRLQRQARIPVDGKNFEFTPLRLVPR